MIIETFDKFNKGCKRYSKHDHLTLCGFAYKGHINPSDGKPKDLAKYIALQQKELSGVEQHCVYFKSGTNMDGQHGYAVYTKAI